MHVNIYDIATCDGHTRRIQNQPCFLQFIHRWALTGVLSVQGSEGCSLRRCTVYARMALMHFVGTSVPTSQMDTLPIFIAAARVTWVETPVLAQATLFVDVKGLDAALVLNFLQCPEHQQPCIWRETNRVNECFKKTMKLWQWPSDLSNCTKVIGCHRPFNLLHFEFMWVNVQKHRVLKLQLGSDVNIWMTHAGTLLRSTPIGQYSEYQWSQSKWL